MLADCCAPSSFDSDARPYSFAISDPADKDDRGSSATASNGNDKTNATAVVDAYPGQPKPYGRVHPTIQQVDATVHDVESLRRTLKADDPLLNWQTISGRHEIDLCNLKTWIPKDDHVAFYTPSSSSRDKYDQLTYRELHQAMAQCRPFLSNGQRDTTNVAIVLPIDQMAHMAMSLLSIIASGATAVPLDPRMHTFRVMEAMEQLQCSAFVAPESVLLEGSLPLLQRGGSETYKINPLLLQSSDSDDKKEHTRLVSFFQEQVEEIRLITYGACGRLEWNILEKLVSEDGTSWKAKPSAAIDRDSQVVSAKSPHDTAMLLRTSGTTNKPKIVPISYSMLAFAGTSIATALKLKRDDCNCNSMPFYHIGGIACNLLAVLISGGSVIMSGPLTDPNAFLDHLIIRPGKKVDATWYYAGPSMHKAILLMAEAQWESHDQCLPNKLRFCRSASAHLNHDMALRLSTVFECQVLPTYGMSEAMPICSSAPIDVRLNPPCEVIDSVGYSVGSSVRILDPETDEVLPHGSDQIGEISVKGPGVIPHYVGLDVTKTHTPEGWLKTGDRGLLDHQGRLFIKGRSKEMIKRGGEQVWPNEIDDVVEKVSGVATAVTFGVPNELWGEEVAVAVVLVDGSQIDDQAYTEKLRDNIMESCRAKLDDLSMPHQIKFLPSTSCLPKGSTGKYIRFKMASHLGVTAVDTGALKVLETVSQFNKAPVAAIDAAAGLDDSLQKEVEEEQEGNFWNSKMGDGRRVVPSDALNGVRFFVACFVLQVHVGALPNLTWVKLQTYAPNMMIFFAIGAFQIACSVARSVKGRWANFVGTKIGSLHALFVVSQFINLPAYLLFRAFDEEGNISWDVKHWVTFSLKFVFGTFTGLGHGEDVNKHTWFQSTFYMFLILFPFMDDYFRRQVAKFQAFYLVVFTIIAFGLWGLAYLVLPSDVFWGYLYPFGWTIATWGPLLVAGMLAAYFFRRIAEYYLRQRNKELEEHSLPQPPTDDPDTLHVEQIQKQSRIWGYVVDGCSVVLLVFALAVALSPNCLCIHEDTFATMRPFDDLPAEECKISSGRDDYAWVCDITFDEFKNYIKDDPNHIEFGKFPSMFSGAIGYMRLSAPLFLLWIAAMGFGNGFTAWFFQTKLMTGLAPLGYPVYLLHMGITRYYWIATRGWNWEPWWDIEGYPFPVEWYEMFALLGITITIGFFVNRFIMPLLMPHSISMGVKVCLFVSRWVKWATCRKDPDDEKEESYDGNIRVSTYNQVKKMVMGLTGVEVTRSMKLRHLGLDSLGATALLGMLRASVPAAKNLSLSQLQECETVGCLADSLDDSVSLTSSSEGGTKRSGSQGGTSSVSLTRDAQP